MYSAEERERAFDRLKAILGNDLAVFCCCAVFNLPYAAEIDSSAWRAYEAEALSIDNTLSFADGERDVHIALNKALPEIEKWRRVWGSGDEKRPYTQKDYERLEELFRAYSERIVKTGGMDAQQEDTIRSCCKMRLLADKCLAAGTRDGVQMNTQLNKTIQENLSAENLRKKDIKPAEETRIDNIVDLLKKKYGKGATMSLDEAVEICSKWLIGHKYKITMDAAEHILSAIINTMRANNDLPALDKLPEAARFSKEMATQFADEPTEAERDAYRYLALERDDGEQ